MADINSLTEFKKRYKDAIPEYYWHKITHDEVTHEFIKQDYNVLAGIDMRTWKKNSLKDDLSGIDVYYVKPIVGFEQAKNREEVLKLCHHSNFVFLYFHKIELVRNGGYSECVEATEEEQDDLCLKLLGREYEIKVPNQHITSESDGTWYQNHKYDEQMAAYNKRISRRLLN